MKLQRIHVIFLAAGAIALGIVAAIAALRPGAEAPKFEAADITGVDWGKGFELTDHLGHKRTLGDFRGKAVAMFFGYTSCPDVCPITMAKLGEAMKLLGEDAKRVQGLFVTVDPKRDTPQVLAQYVPAFYPSFLGLYADPDTTSRTAKEFKIYYHAQPPNQQGFYTVDHSSSVLVFDPQGRLRLSMASHLAPESMARDLRLLVRQSAP